MSGKIKLRPANITMLHAVFEKADRDIVPEQRGPAGRALGRPVLRAIGLRVDNIVGSQVGLANLSK